jgi:hypothetical protein
MSDSSEVSEDEEEKKLTNGGPTINGETGLPEVSEADKEKGKKSAPRGLVIQLVVARIIGTLIAFAIVRLVNFSDFNQRIKVLRTPFTDAPDLNMHLESIYLALAILSVLVSFLNMYPMVYKAAVLPGNAGNLRANMLIYKANFSEGNPGKLPYVVMEEIGDIGCYNRANRSLHHFNENSACLTALVVAAGLVLPGPTLTITVLYALCRVWYQVAYTIGGYGFGLCKHAVPFMVHTLMYLILEGFVWVAAGGFMLISD